MYKWLVVPRRSLPLKKCCFEFLTHVQMAVIAQEESAIEKMLLFSKTKWDGEPLM
jgi:hypothetical protein